jgi:hypothetical protein
VWIRTSSLRFNEHALPQIMLTTSSEHFFRHSFMLDSDSDTGFCRRGRICFQGYKPMNDGHGYSGTRSASDSTAPIRSCEHAMT